MIRITKIISPHTVSVTSITLQWQWQRKKFKTKFTLSEHVTYCNVYLIMIWFETGNLDWKFYLLHADRKQLPCTFVWSANADAVHWTWRRRAAESDMTVHLTFGLADITLRLYINPIGMVNEIHYVFNTQHLSVRLLKLHILYWRRS